MLYVAAPCAIIKSFQIERTVDKMQGFMLAVGAAIIVHIVYLLGAYFLGKVKHFNSIEKACLIYSNCGNLIIPLVGVVLGPKMVFYTSGYMMVQTVLLWTHCKFLISQETGFTIKKIIFNFNIMAMCIGILLFIIQMELPLVISSAMTSLSNLMGPLSMIVVGMLLSKMNFKEILTKKRAYVISFFRLIIFPAIVLVIFITSKMSHLVSNGEQILMVSLLAASAPSASTITNFAQLYNNRAEEAGIINAISVLFCIVSMPLIIMLYTLFV